MTQKEIAAIVAATMAQMNGAKMKEIHTSPATGNGQMNYANNYISNCPAADPPPSVLPQGNEISRNLTGGAGRNVLLSPGTSRGSKTRLTLDIDFSEATADADVLLFDGNFMFELLIDASIFSGAVTNKWFSGYAGIGADIAGTWGDNMLELLSRRTAANPFIITNIAATALTGGSVGVPATTPDLTYFNTYSFTEQWADNQGNNRENTIHWPTTKPEQFTQNVRQFCDYSRLIDGNSSMLIPMQAGNKLTFTFFIQEAADARYYRDADQSC